MNDQYRKYRAKCMYAVIHAKCVVKNALLRIQDF